MQCQFLGEVFPVKNLFVAIQPLEPIISSTIEIKRSKSYQSTLKQLLIDNKQYYKFLGKDIHMISLIKLYTEGGKVVRHEDCWDKKPLRNRETVKVPSPDLRDISLFLSSISRLVKDLKR
ncbi:hypothetical protein H5410_055143 [Solanum commersonii]|uniref:Uncharacterized protein n=1 Tax=Solanum commersonii TaxID=4109 RepID=A0A9J5WGT1_SOLCO|nr:hypothetical protein H5410_055143 [Solanum commersonii]